MQISWQSQHNSNDEQFIWDYIDPCDRNITLQIPGIANVIISADKIRLQTPTIRQKSQLLQVWTCTYLNCVHAKMFNLIVSFCICAGDKLDDRSGMHCST